VQDVADLMGTTKQAASKLLDAMEASRLVERVPDPDDGRARVVVLTRRGRRMLRCVESIYRDIESEWSEVIGDRELEAVRACLSKLVRDAHGGQLPALRPIW
jgi:DNA-binding MarR family transcriptional regulator